MYGGEWYNSLNKPFLNPPGEIFAPVWTILYIMIALAFIFYIKGGITKGKIVPLIFFFIQLFLNFSWSPVFFIFHDIALALIIIVLMWFFTALTVLTFMFYSKKAALLLVPYLLWITFALYLNFGFFVLN